jgi:hypothetical protein
VTSVSYARPFKGCSMTLREAAFGYACAAQGSGWLQNS